MNEVYWSLGKDLKQEMGKMVSEVGELCDAIIKDDKNGQIDGIGGDVLVTLLL